MINFIIQNPCGWDGQCLKSIIKIFDPFNVSLKVMRIRILIFYCYLFLCKHEQKYYCFKGNWEIKGYFIYKVIYLTIRVKGNFNYYFNNVNNTFWCYLQIIDTKTKEVEESILNRGNLKDAGKGLSYFNEEIYFIY